MYLEKTMPSKSKPSSPATLFRPFITLFFLTQGEAGEAGNPGPHGEPGLAVSAGSCWSMQFTSYIFLTITKFPGSSSCDLQAFSLVPCLPSFANAD